MRERAYVVVCTPLINSKEKQKQHNININTFYLCIFITSSLHSSTIIRRDSFCLHSGSIYATQYAAWSIHSFGMSVNVHIFIMSIYRTYISIDCPACLRWHVSLNIISHLWFYDHICVKRQSFSINLHKIEMKHVCDCWCCERAQAIHSYCSYWWWIHLDLGILTEIHAILCVLCPMKPIRQQQQITFADFIHNNFSFE